MTYFVEKIYHWFDVISNVFQRYDLESFYIIG